MSFSGFGIRPADADEQNPDDTVWGRDETEIVGVGLSPDEDLRDLTISPDWRKKVSAGDLGSTVMVAYMGAVGACVRARALTPRENTTADVSGNEMPTIDSYLLDAVTRERDHYFAMYETELQAEHSFSSPDQNVTVTAHGGSPSTVTFDSMWLSFASGPDIAATTREPFAQAMASGRSIDEKIQHEFPAIAEFRRLRAIKRAIRGW